MERTTIQNESRGPMRSGFTMLELLVSVASTLVMVLFLHQIFSSMALAVVMGKATSDIINGSRVLSQQLGEDGQAMVGAVPPPNDPNKPPPYDQPAQPGFLVIMQQSYPAVLRAGEQPRRVRSDQIIWIVDRRSYGSGPPQPRSPGYANSFADAESDARYARVWYGHVSPADANGFGTNSHPGGPGNLPASNWVLGRHTLFFDAAAATQIHIDYQGRTDDSAFWFVRNYPLNGPGRPPALHWHVGLSDVINQDFAGVLIDFLAMPPVKGYPYPQGPYQYTFGFERLWCNTDPTPGAAPQTWQVAQMHPYLVGNVSDFQIDFAGDLVDNLNPLREPDGMVDLVNDEIKWYSHFFNNDSKDPAMGFSGHYLYDADNDGVVDADEVEPYRDDLPTTYHTPVRPEGLTNTAPPAMRPTYHRKDDVGPTGFGIRPQNAEAAFVWQSNGAQVYSWPQLIRFRYRIHDRSGKLGDRDGALGKLFERIIQVKAANF